MTRRAALTVRLPGGQNHAGDQDEQMAPDRGGEELPEGFHQRGQDRRQGLCRDRFVGAVMLGHRKVGIPLRRIVISVQRQRLAAF